jgi:hypothetical protein
MINLHFAYFGIHLEPHRVQNALSLSRPKIWYSINKIIYCTDLREHIYTARVENSEILVSRPPLCTEITGFSGVKIS